MERLKIKVNNEAESKEAQELFFELGASLGNGDNHAVTVPNIMGLAVIDGLINFVFNSVVFSDIKQCKEVTLTKLRDMVVLKRNDVNDATHEFNDGSKVYVSSNYVCYAYQNYQWGMVTSGSSNVNLKPIDKEMKEYLDPDNEYTLILADDELAKGTNWIEVPKGMNFAYKNDFNIHFTRVEMGYRDSVVIWQRPTHSAIAIGSQLDSLAKLNGFRQRFLGEDDDHYREEIVKHRDNKSLVNKSINCKRENNHYFIDVSDVDEIDFYEIAKRYNVTDPAIQHILKKCLAVGGRGHKDLETDLKDIFKTAKRALEINNIDMGL